MDLTRLHYFVAVAEAGSFSRAAAALHQSQPALSRQVLLLEEEVGQRLLERTGVFRSSFTGNSETFFLEGQRNVGLMLMAQIHDACPEKYTAMLEEQKHDAGNDDDGSADNDH